MKPPSIIKRLFYIDGDPPEDMASFHYAHWIISVSTLQSLTKNVIDVSKELKTVYATYMNPKTEEKGNTDKIMIDSMHYKLSKLDPNLTIFHHACIT